MTFICLSKEATLYSPDLENCEPLLCRRGVFFKLVPQIRFREEANPEMLGAAALTTRIEEFSLGLEQQKPV